MSSPVPIGDIIAAVLLVAQIYEKCFTRAQAADQKYLQFGEEIKHFGESLDRLNDVISHVERQREIRAAYLPYNNRAQIRSTLQPLPDLTGDFYKTLRACERLLNDNSKFRRNPAGFVDNVRWWLGVEGEIELLKERIRFHTTKILLITKPVEMQLLSDLCNEVYEVRKVVEEIRGLLVSNSLRSEPPETPAQFRLPLVPPDLDARFLAAIQNKSAPPRDVTDFPLREGFDALVFHFQQSTVDFVPRVYSEQKTPGLTQYLNLIKSTWILERITESRHFIQNSLWSRCVEDIGNNILREYHRFDSGQLISPGDEVITRLEDHAFSIWIEDQGTEVVPTMMDERPGEEKLLEIALPKSQNGRKPSLVIMRKSDQELRIVHTTKDEGNELFFEAESYDMNIQFTRFIPIYAVPDSVSSISTNNILFCSSHGQSEKAYSFGSLDDVYRLQQAVTGYKVGADLSNVAWSTFKESENGKCRIQIWRHKPLPRITPADDGGLQSPLIGIRRESTNKSTSRSTTLSAGSLAASVAATAKGSIVQGTRGPAVMFPKPDTPVVVLFTLCKDVWTFLHFEVTSNVIINPKACNCKECKGPSKICRRIVIETKKDKLRINRQSAGARNGVNMWDLALLRKPQHPSAHKSMSLFPVKYILLAFASIEDKIEFQDTFNQVKKLLEKDEQDYKRAILQKDNNSGRRAIDIPTSPVPMKLKPYTGDRYRESVSSLGTLSSSPRSELPSTPGIELGSTSRSELASTTRLELPPSPRTIPYSGDRYRDSVSSLGTLPSSPRSELAWNPKVELASTTRIELASGPNTRLASIPTKQLASSPRVEVASKPRIELESNQMFELESTPRFELSSIKDYEVCQWEL